jgi:riboflavin synthase
LRLTTFGARDLGSSINLEIERSTQVTVDTIRDFLEERLGPLLPRLESLVGELGDPHFSPFSGGRGDKREE